MRRPDHRRIHLLTLTVIALATQQAFAYPEFQKYVQQNSGRNVNCAMCHAHPDGPEGLKPGQIGSLKPQELDLLNRARAAFEPGQEVQSPILNAFGNDIVKRLGKSQFLLLRQDPQKLAEALGAESDLDGDSICDADEYLAGPCPWIRITAIHEGSLSRTFGAISFKFSWLDWRQCSACMGFTKSSAALN
jgi:hypothetical protein